MMAKAKKYNTSSFSSSSGDGWSNGSAAGETTTTVAYSSSHDSASSGSSSAHSSINNNNDNINHANVAQKMPGQSLTIRPLWRNGEKTFPYKVYDMLEFAEASGNNNICSWSRSGNSFVIHNRDLFIEFILPRFFLHKKWRSFTRQLNIWCFQRTLGSISGEYYHQYFRRGDLSQISLVERAESKNMYKKDPITNKRKFPKPLEETKTFNEGSSDSCISIRSTEKRSALSPKQLEDVNEVATFLAGLRR